MRRYLLCVIASDGRWMPAFHCSGAFADQSFQMWGDRTDDGILWYTPVRWVRLRGGLQ